MNTIIATPINNTVTDTFIDQTFDDGRSQYNRLFIPNQAIADNGDMLHFFPYAAIAIKDRIAIDEKNVFLKNGYMEKPGIIVEKYYISKKHAGILLGDEKYFRVIDSNIDQVCQNNLVIVMAGQSQRFNLNQKEYFFVQPDKVLVSINEQGIISGPSNILLKPIEPEILGMDTKTPNKGTHDGDTYYFGVGLYDITISNEKYIVVAKKDVVLTETLT